MCSSAATAAVWRCGWVMSVQGEGLIVCEAVVWQVAFLMSVVSFMNAMHAGNKTKCVMLVSIY